MRRYQVQITELIPDKMVFKMTRKERKMLIDADNGYYFRVFDFGRFTTYGSAQLVCELLTHFWKRVSEYEYQVQVIEVEELVQKVLYTPLRENKALMRAFWKVSRDIRLIPYFGIKAALDTDSIRKKMGQGGSETHFIRFPLRDCMKD